jgi:hypothetical protein
LAWICIAVLPNIHLKEPIEFDSIAMASAQDPRAAGASQHPNLSDFLSRFHDAHGVPITPSVILWNAADETDLPPFDAVCSFRDAIAASYVLLERAQAMSRSRVSSTPWMDSFSIYPWMLSKDSQNLIRQTPAVWAMHDIQNFQGQTSPEHIYQTLRESEIDKPLLDALAHKWREAFLEPRSGAHADVALFRSLNMAYRAGSLPGGWDATIYDFGRSTSLWVAAFEILCHPGGNGKVGLQQVYELLGSASYTSEKVSRLAYEAFSGRSKPREKRNLPCWLYGEIYHARNDFLHGNPLGSDRLIVPGSGRMLPDFAALVYRLALASKLNIAWTEPKPPDSEGKSQWHDDKEAFMRPQEAIERALLKYDVPKYRSTLQAQ